MCDQHQPPTTTLPLDEARERLEVQLDQLQELETLHPTMSPRDKQFAESLLQQFTSRIYLSAAQWDGVNVLVSRYQSREPIYGSFNAILVMFRLAQAHGLKRPRIRLLSSDPDPIYFELWFKPGSPEERTIEIMRGGWQGSGQRRFAGWITNDHIVPWIAQRLTVGMRNVIQDLALDPVGTAKAMAAKLSVCMYCGQRLSDPESKTRGYGGTCATNYNLPWGKRTEAVIATLDRLSSSVDAIWEL